MDDFQIRHRLQLENAKDRICLHDPKFDTSNMFDRTQVIYNLRFICKYSPNVQPSSDAFAGPCIDKSASSPPPLNWDNFSVPHSQGGPPLCPFHQDSQTLQMIFLCKWVPKISYASSFSSSFFISLQRVCSTRDWGTLICTSILHITLLPI